MTAKLKMALKSPIESTIGAILVLALIQPFGLDRMEEQRLIYIFLLGVACYLSGFVSFWIADFTASKFLKNIVGEKKHFVLITLNFLFTIPLLSLLNVYLDSVFNDFTLTLQAYLRMLMFVALLALFLFFWACLRFKNNKLSRELDEMRAINALLEQRQDELAQLAENNSSDSAAGKARDSGLVSSSAGSTLCVLKGQNSGPAFEVPGSSIVYVESIANYADICYMEDDKMLHKTLRITLKSVKDSIGESNSLVQCHRAFIVNLNFVLSMEKLPNGTQLRIFGSEKRIPVSRSNSSAIKEALQNGIS